jgi:putative transposase
MKRRRHTPEQVIRKLREADKMLGEGKTIAEVAKALEISENSYHRWRNQYGGMKADDAKRLKELERENVRLKRIVADQALENQALKEINRGRMKVKCGPGQFVGGRCSAVVVGGCSQRRCVRRRLGRAERFRARARGAARG